MRNASFMDGRRQPLMHSNTTQIESPSPHSSFALQYPPQTSAKGQKYASRSYQTTPKGTHAQPAKMGIKSGMTVEDLKRLTQQRMQSQPLAPSTTSSSTSVTPNSLNKSSRAPVSGGQPKGMTVQELKQLTSLRLATQMNFPAKQVSMSSADKTVLSNVAKAHYRQCLMPSGAGQQSMYQTSSACMNTHSFASSDPTPNEFRRLGEVKEFRPAHFYPIANHQTENETLNPLSSDESDDNEHAHKHQSSFRLPDEAFPPPPMSENASFIPSWSPPPSRPKTLDTIAPPPVPFYSHQHQHMSYKEYEASDQNAIIAPPPGLVRRPSMTVPWQVAEAVLNTPQMTVNRKTLLSPNHPSNSKRMQQVSLTRGNSSGLKSPAAEAATQLGSFPGHLVRQRSIPSDSANTPNTAMFSPTHSIKRASFGNAAEFFKFRRRSKSRLELAREISDGKGVTGTGNQFKNVSMPGIDEQMVIDHRSDTFVESDKGMQALGVEDRLLASMNISSDFIPFYQAVVSTNASARASEISSEHSIPPPPPEEEDSTDGDDGPSRDSKGLPMMSPNGVRLRKVAEMARRGSLSSADKNRFKDEIIQSSLGIGLSSFNDVAAIRQDSKPTRSSPTRFSGKSLDVDGTSADRSEILGADVPLEERLRVAAQLVADCVRQGKMTEFHSAMKQLDALRNEATSIMRH